MAISDIYYIDMPDSIRGATIPDPEAQRFIIGINARLPADRQRAALEHELAHIYLEHFTDPRPLEAIENEAAEATKGGPAQ